MARLRTEPPTRVDTLADLVGIAHTIETEAIRSYTRLAAEMRRRGEIEAAEAMEAMAREEDAHVAAVEGWAKRLDQPVPDDERFRWRLPVDLAATWDEVAGSSLLTPFRVYAIAADNEQRAFAFYAYLSASAEDPTIAREAEALAREELRHAALLRTWRRKAWRRERQVDRQAGRPATPGRDLELDIDPDAVHLTATVEAAEAEIAACHRLLSDRLRAAGDPEGAALLQSLAGEAAARGGAAEGCSAEECVATTPVALLLAAQRPLERLCELLEDALLAAPDERVQTVVQDSLSHAISRIARLGRRIETLEAAVDEND